MATQTLADLLLLASKHGPTRFGIQESQLAKLIADGIAASDVESVNGLTGVVTAGTVGDTTGASSTVGSIPFIGTGKVWAQSNTQLFWDNTNSRLGIGTASPSNQVTSINASSTLTGALFQNSNATGTGRAFLVQQLGLGRGLEVSMSNVASVGAGLRIDATHAGEAVRLSATTGRVISATNTGLSTGIFMSSTNTASPASSIYGSSAGTGVASYGGVTGEVTGSGIGSGILAVRNSAGRSLRIATSAGAAISLSPSFTMPAGNSYDLVFPSSQGSAGDVLVNDGAGNLSWQPN